MNQFKTYQFGGKNSSPLGSFGALLALVAVLFVGFYMIKGLFAILSIVAPILLLGALVLDYKTVTGYGKFLWRLLRENPLYGVLGIVLTVVGWHIVSGFLFIKALTTRGMRRAIENVERRQKGEYVAYEEVTDEEDFLELPKAEPSKQKPTSKSGGYEDLFN